FLISRRGPAPQPARWSAPHKSPQRINAGTSQGLPGDFQTQPPYVRRLKMGANNPRRTDTTKTPTPARRVKTGEVAVNGLSGRANAQTAKASVAANISQSGQARGSMGSGAFGSEPRTLAA